MYIYIYIYIYIYDFIFRAGIKKWTDDSHNNGDYDGQSYGADSIV